MVFSSGSGIATSASSSGAYGEFAARSAVDHLDAPRGWRRSSPLGRAGLVERGELQDHRQVIGQLAFHLRNRRLGPP